MLLVKPMSRKIPADVPSGQEAAGGGSKPKRESNVKLSPLFHKRLKMIAVAKGKDMGELVEDAMHTFMVREWEHLTKRKWSDPD